MIPIQLTLDLVPIKTEVTFGNPKGPIRKITFALADEPGQKIILTDSFPNFDDIWKTVAPKIKVPPPGEFITQMYERYQG